MVKSLHFEGLPHFGAPNIVFPLYLPDFQAFGHNTLKLSSNPVLVGFRQTQVSQPFAHLGKANYRFFLR